MGKTRVSLRKVRRTRVCSLHQLFKGIMVRKGEDSADVCVLCSEQLTADGNRRQSNLAMSGEPSNGKRISVVELGMLIETPIVNLESGDSPEAP